jgi:hypothetical protein
MQRVAVECVGARGEDTDPLGATRSEFLHVELRGEKVEMTVMFEREHGPKALGAPAAISRLARLLRALIGLVGADIEMASADRIGGDRARFLYPSGVPTEQGDRIPGGVIG